jgi:pyruvate dehydrogenase E1 component
MILAYTTKGWGLPMAGHLENHAALLTDEQLSAFQQANDIAAGAEWSGFCPGSPEAAWLQQRLQQRGFPTSTPTPQAPRPPRVPAVTLPESFGPRYPSVTSTQAAFGQMLAALSDLPQLGERLVTISPDVAVSTNLGACNNRRGIYAPAGRPNHWHQHGVETLLQWNEGPRGQHIELGIAEHNFYLALSMLGLAPEMQGEMLWPIGTIYDPFVERGLDALKYGTYAHSKFIFVGTPSGLTLCREAGAHQSFLTPLLGVLRTGLCRRAGSHAGLGSHPAYRPPARGKRLPASQHPRRTATAPPQHPGLAPAGAGRGVLAARPSSAA